MGQLVTLHMCTSERPQQWLMLQLPQPSTMQKECFVQCNNKHKLDDDNRTADRCMFCAHYCIRAYMKVNMVTRTAQVSKYKYKYSIN